MEDMIKRSFSEFATQRALGARNLPLQLQKAEKVLEKIRKEGLAPCLRGDPPAIEDYYAQSRRTARQTTTVVAQALNLAKTGNKSMLGEGRFLKVTLPPALVNVWGLVVRGLEGGEGGREGGKQVMTVLILCPEGFLPPTAVEKEEAGAGRKKGERTETAEAGRVPLPPFGGKGLIPAPQTTGGTPHTASGMTDEENREVYGTAGSRHFAVRTISLEDVIFVTGRRRKDRFDSEKILAFGDALQRPTRQLATMSLPSLPVSTAIPSVIADLVKDLVACEEAEAHTQSLSPSSPPAALPLAPLNFPKELKINDLSFIEAYSRLQPEQEALFASKCHTCPILPAQYAHVHRRRRVEAKVESMRHLLSNESLSLFPEFQDRLRVLSALGYIDSTTQAVQLKGRVACEVNTCDELLLTETVFENVLAPLTPAEIAGLLSVLVCQEKGGRASGNGEGHEAQGGILDPATEEAATIPPALRQACRELLEIARNLGDVQRRFSLPSDPESYAAQHVNLIAVGVVYAWASGVSFREIMATTEIQEGSIVRCITRLDELCREVRNAARLMGDPALYRKMEEASERIRRDIVFAGSLYLT